MEINEPIPDGSEDLPDGKIPEETPLVPLHSLPADERALRKSEMERILDALEEEEAQENRAAREKEAAVNHAFLAERRRESETLRKAAEERRKRDKKMGKALLGALTSSPPPSASPTAPATPDSATTSQAAKKKSVKFEEPEQSSSHTNDGVKKKADWGDVLAALPSSSSRRLMHNSPMKSDVVERFPAKQKTASPSITSINTPLQVDSDDEDEVAQSLDSSHSEDTKDSQEEGFEDGLDLMDALHQQEIAAEYYARREGIMNSNVLAEAVGASAAAEKNNPWDKEHVPLDATLAHPQQSKGSRFKTSRQRPFAPQSIEGTILPASMLRGAVRMGKVEDGELVGVADDSEDELVADVEEKLAINKAKRALLGPSTPDADAHSDSGTPIMNDPRSSPKLHPDEEFAMQTSVHPEARMPRSPLAASPPTFPPPTRPMLASDTRSTQSQKSGIVPGLGFSSMIIESPSFAAPPAHASIKPKAPPVMADTVRESSSLHSSTVATSANTSSRTPPKVSRFKAART